MVYDLLSKLKLDGSLGECSITVSDKRALRKQRTLFGRDIIRITTSRIEMLGGETGHERLSIPLDKIQEICFRSQVIYRKKKRIERIYLR